MLIGVLTSFHSSGLKTSSGKDLNSGSSRVCDPHNASNTGSSNPLLQHASAAAVAPAFDATSSWAMSLTISSTLRQGCIGLGLGDVLDRVSVVRGKVTTVEY